MSRERDSLGRPLPEGVVGEPGIPPLPRNDDTVVWAEAIAYLESEHPFHAHEVFEERWRNCSLEDRDLWRSLAQWAAAETHAARGNAIGAAALAERAVEGLGSVGHCPDGLDLTRVRVRCAELITPGSEGDTSR